MSFTLLRFRYAANLAGVQLGSGLAVVSWCYGACSTTSKKNQAAGIHGDDGLTFGKLPKARSRPRRLVGRRTSRNSFFS
jgi:hypothetical protein